jgi:hypothetical protein
MVRRRRAEVNMFNFSFVDILATTIGVIIFILVLVLITATDRLSPEKLQKTLDEIHETTAENNSEADSMRQEIADEHQRREASQTPDEHLQLAEKAVLDEKNRAKSLELAQAKLKAEAARLEREVEDVEKELEQFAKSAKKVDRSRGKVEFRIPKLRATSKVPYTFECDGGRIYFLASYYAGIAKENYNEQSLGFFSILTRKASAKGDQEHDLMRSGSRFRKRLRKMKRKKHFGNFIVRPDGYDVFRAARKQLWSRGFKVNWKPLGEKEDIVSGGGGGQSTQ